MSPTRAPSGRVGPSVGELLFAHMPSEYVNLASDVSRFHTEEKCRAYLELAE